MGRDEKSAGMRISVYCRNILPAAQDQSPFSFETRPIPRIGLRGQLVYRMQIYIRL